MRGEWNAPATSSGRARTLYSRAASSASSSAPRSPDRTTWPGALSLATVTPAAWAIAWASSIEPPSRASIEPESSASAIRRPRRTTSSSASSVSSTPAAVSAPSSPSEWPAAIVGSASEACQPAIDAQKIAGWAKRVESSTRGNGSSPTSSMQRSSRSGSSRATSSRMSGVWEPWPGNSRAMSVRVVIDAHPGRCEARLPALAHSHPPGGGACAMRWGVTGFAPVSRLRSVAATRYVTPLREGGSLPGLVEADDDGLYVLKFRGAGQGIKALVAEIVAGELARGLGLAVPEIVRMSVDPALGAAEPDPEIQDLITGSAGENVGLDFLPGSLPYTPAAGFQPTPELAAEVVWLDALVSNVDRTPRNPNLLVWHERLWLIDHGAALYFHHREWDAATEAPRPFAGIGEHGLLPCAASVAEADERLGERLDSGVVRAAVEAVPGDWLEVERYVQYLTRRLAAPRAFAAVAERARQDAVRAPHDAPVRGVS